MEYDSLPWDIRKYYHRSVVDKISIDNDGCITLEHKHENKTLANRWKFSDEKNKWDWDWGGEV